MNITNNSIIIDIPAINSLDELPNFLKNLNIGLKININFNKKNINNKLLIFFYKYLSL